MRDSDGAGVPTVAGMDYWAWSGGVTCDCVARARREPRRCRRWIGPLRIRHCMEIFRSRSQRDEEFQRYQRLNLGGHAGPPRCPDLVPRVLMIAAAAST